MHTAVQRSVSFCYGKFKEIARFRNARTEIGYIPTLEYAQVYRQNVDELEVLFGSRKSKEAEPAEMHEPGEIDLSEAQIQILSEALGRGGDNSLKRDFFGMKFYELEESLHEAD